MEALASLLVKLLEILVGTGNVFAVAIAAILIMGVLFVGLGLLFHLSKVGDLRARITEHKDDKVQLISLVKSNTEAISSNTSAVQNCTSAIEQNTQLVQRILEKR